MASKQPASGNLSHFTQSDSAAGRTVRSGPARGRGRRPVSDGQPIHSGESGRLRPAEPRPGRPAYDVNRQRLSSSEESPLEV